MSAPARSNDVIEPGLFSKPSIEFVKYIIAFVLAGSAAYLIALFYLAPEQTIRAYAIAMLLIVGGAGWFLLSRQRVLAAIWTLAIGIWAQITVASLFLGGLSSGATVIYPLIILSMGWLVGTRAAVVIALLTAAVTLALAVVQTWGFLPHSLPTPPAMLWVLQCVALTLSVVLISHVVRSYRNRLEEVRALDSNLVIRSADLKSNETALLSARNQLAATLDAIPDLLFEMGLDGRYHECRSPRTDLLAAPVKDLIGNTVSSILPATAADVCMSALREAHETGRSHGKQFELPLPQGNLWFELAVSRKPVDPGQPPRFIVLSRDITERKRAEAELRASEVQLQCILGATADGILAVDGNGKVIRTNKRFAQLWRIPQTLLDSNDEKALLDCVLAQLTDPEAFLKKVRDLYDSDAEITDSVHFKDGRTFERLTSPLILNGANIGRVWSFRDITEREQAESALLDSRSLLQTVIDTAPVRVFWKDRDLRYLGCNPEFAKDAGEDHPDNVIGKDDLQLAWAAHAERYRADDRAVMNSGVAKLAYEEPQTTPDGRNICLRTSKVPLRNRRNETIGLMGIYEDITEQKNVQQRLNMAIEVTRVVLWELDFRSDRLTYDHAMLPTLSLETSVAPDSMRSWIERVLPEDRDTFLAHLARALEPGDAAFDFEYRMSGNAGEVQWIHSWGRVVQRDERGQPEIAVGTSMNISARKQIEVARRSSEERSRNLASMLRLMCDNVPDMIWAKDLNMRYVFANKAICEHLLNAADTEEPLGKNDMFFAQRERASHPENSQWHTFGELCQDSDAITLKRGEPSIFEEFGNVKGKHLLLAVHKAPFYDAAGKIIGTVGSARDITEHKRLEESRQQSQKLESLGTLAGGIAHDFNNALAAIIGNLELARQDVGPEHEALISLEEIGKASRRAKNLVQQILTFGRRQNFDRKVMSLSLPVLESVRLVRATLPARTDLRVDCGVDTPAVLADATQVEQILINLCTNAIQAVQEQSRPGVVDVCLKAHTSTGTDGGLRPGVYACLSVRDNGPGMDESTRSRIFEPFFTTKSKGKGTGLGLAVVHGIVKAHEANIDVVSAPEEGSEFRIYFPAAEMPVADVRALSPNAAAGLSTGKRVLYVDDEEAIIFLVTRLLERQGFRVSGYTDPRDALAAAQANPEQFDLAVTDYNMPGMSGLEVAIALREIRADLPVIMASGYITEELRKEAPAAGIRELIYKPNTVEDLCEAVAHFANAQSRGKVIS